MIKYHKIQTVYNRDPETNFKTLLEGEFSCPEFEYLFDQQWICTEKVDGTNSRVGWDGVSPELGGKTDNAQIPASLIKVLQKKITAKLFSSVFDHGDVTLFGEGYGARIKKGSGNYKSDGVDFVLFDVNIGGIWLRRDDVKDIANKLNIGVVPITTVCTLEEAVSYVKDGFKSAWGDFLAEGLVCRPVIELQTRMGERIITKIKTKDFIRP